MTVNLNHINLDNLTIASPCTADWNAMTGDDRVRHCPQCKLNVYNLSELSRAQAERLLKDKEGKLCVQYFQRHDGTILTQNCPAALRRAQQAAQRLVAAIAALFGIVLTGASGCLQDRRVRGSPTFPYTGQATQSRSQNLSPAPDTRAGFPVQPAATQPSITTQVLTAEPVPTPNHEP